MGKSEILIAKLFSGIVTIISLSGNVAGQDTTSMGLRACMEYALSNSTKMRIQEADASDARIGRRDAILGAVTPNINANTYAYYNFGRSIDPKTNTYFNTTSFHNNYGVSAGFDLFDGFKAVNNVRIAKTSLAISQSNKKQAEADICLAVMEAYYNVVYYKHLTSILAEQAKIAEDAVAKAERQEELGQKGHADVVSLKADLAEREYDLINAESMYQNQLTALSDLMFYPLDMELKIDTSVPEIVFDTVGEQSLVDYATGNNPAILIAGNNLEKARLELNTARWSLLPTLGLYAGWNTSYYTYQGSETSPFKDQFSNNRGEYVELSLSIPIWNRLKGHSDIARKKNAFERANADFDQKRREVESEVRRAMQDRDAAYSAYSAASRKTEVQKEAFNLNRMKMEQGLISPLEYQSAANNYLKARSDDMNSKFKFLIKQAVVRYYGGVDYLNQ